MAYLRTLFGLLVPAQRTQALALLAAAIVAAALETIGIGLVIPFISLISAPDSLQHFGSFAKFFAAVGIDPADRSALVVVVVALIVVYAVKNLFLAFIAYAQARFNNGVFSSIAERLFTTYLACPYAYHLQHNSSESLRVITSDAHAITNAFLRPGFIVVTETAVLCAVTALLFAVQPVATIVIIGTFGVIGFGLNRLVKPMLRRAGQQYLKHHTGMLKWVSQGLDCIKEIKVLQREPYFVQSFTAHGDGYANSAALNQFAQQLPRLIMETFVVTAMLTGILVALRAPGGHETILPLIGLFAAAAFRLMPSVTRIVTALNQAQFSLVGLQTVERDLRLEPDVDHLLATPDQEITFSHEIAFEDVSFQYDNSSSAALDHIDLVIPRGSTIGFVGPSGAGKSTLIDVLMGLLRPSNGRLLIDGTDVSTNLPAWRKRIGYIPQTIALLDDSVRRNIAFGLPEDLINDDRLSKAIQAAQLDLVIANLPDGLDTIIGERGVRLSGGQRQRIAIARALYYDPDVLVMDEATAALDNETEHEVSQAIEKLGGNKTIIIIAHRLSTVRNCDCLYFMHDGRISGQGAFECLMQNPQFLRMASAENTSS